MRSGNWIKDTHLDSLKVRLRDPKIKRVVEAIIAGFDDPSITRTDPDVERAVDFGLIKRDSSDSLKISNPVYEDVMIRYLSSGYHDNMPPPSDWKWQKPDGSLDMDSLLKEFQRFWRCFSEQWEQKVGYTEAFPHLMLTAFLQRLLNGGGRTDREVAAGRGRMDLRIEYKGEKYIIEVKLIRDRDNPEKILKDGLTRIAAYRDKAAPNAPSYLMIFDRREEAKAKSWDERISWETEGEVTVVRC